MSFREKSAWITFILVLIVLGFWLRNVVRHEVYHLHSGNPMLEAFAVLVAFVAAEVVLHLAIAFHSPSDARAPKDERDQLIALKATRVGFYVLAACAWMAVGSMHLRFSVTFIAQNVMGALFIAELAKLGTQIVLYRRGA